MLEVWTLSVIQRMIRRSPLSPIRGVHTPMPEHWQASDPWKGNPSKGQLLVSGKNPAALYSKDWHKFGWLRDMREYGGSQSRTLARRFVLEWTDQNQRWSSAIWHPQLLADRIRTCVLTWGWFAASATPPQQQLIANSLASQALILSKDWRSIKGGNARIEALSALILAKTFLVVDADPAPFGYMLIEEIATLILPDGCHASRQPDLHIDLLRYLIESRIGLSSMVARLDTPNAHLNEMLASIDDSINRMGAVARMWRHGNGRLMGILGSHEVDLTRLNDVLDRAGPKGRITNHASDSGFLRMASGRSLLLMNTGISARGAGLANIIAGVGKPDAGALAIEFSNGAHSIIINAGQKKALFDTAPDLAAALASTAASSTLSVDRINSSDLDANMPDADIKVGRIAVTDSAETGPAPGGLLAEAKHNGYEKTHGLIHQRRVFLATGGNDLRGEDVVLYSGAPGHIPSEAIIRFHLHPKINASMSIGGDVILRLPGNASAWHFKANFMENSGDIAVEDSVIMGELGLEKCTQITLTMPLGNIRADYSSTVKWGLRRQVKTSA